MRSLRARLVVLTLMLLAQQSVALVLAGVLACCDADVAPAAGARTECCKEGGAGHMCPLTKRPAPERGCRMKQGCSNPEHGMLAGAGFVYAAPLVARFSMLFADRAPMVWQFALPTETLASIPPRTPPPKA